VLETARSWQDRVVAPLRAVRRELKTRLTDADPALHQPLGATRRQLAQVELASERAQLIMLERLAAGCPAGSTDPAIAVRALRQLGLLASKHETSIAVLLRAAFPGHNVAGQAAPTPA
jgi:hypothetical protein